MLILLEQQHTEQTHLLQKSDEAICNAIKQRECPHYHVTQFKRNLSSPLSELPWNAYRLTALRQDAGALVPTQQVVVVKASEGPAPSSQSAQTTPPPAVMSLPQPWQQRIELVASVFTASSNLAVSQLQRLREAGAADAAAQRSGTVTYQLQPSPPVHEQAVCSIHPPIPHSRMQLTLTRALTAGNDQRRTGLARRGVPGRQRRAWRMQRVPKSNAPAGLRR